MKKISVIIAIIVIALALIVFVSSRSRSMMSFELLGHDVDLILVRSPLLQAQGLSGQSLEEFTEKADGMLFVFSDEKERTFWMKGMEFNLDIVWLRDGKVMKVETSVPAPKDGEEPRKMHSAPFEVDAVLELPEGGVYKYGITTGQRIQSLDID